MVDVAAARPEVDAERRAHRLSFGGYTAPRAASGEHRLAACVADSGPYDLYDTVIARMPGVLAHQLPDGNRLMLSVLEKALESTMKKPSAGWALRRNLWVHGVEDPMAYVELAREYSMKGREHLVRCPTFVCRTAGDDISADAQKLADAPHLPHRVRRVRPRRRRHRALRDDRPRGVPPAPVPLARRRPRRSLDARAHGVVPRDHELLVTVVTAT